MSRAVREALETVATPEVASRMLFEALTEARLSSLPEQHDDLRSFAEVELSQVVHETLGPDAATMVRERIELVLRVLARIELHRPEAKRPSTRPVRMTPRAMPSAAAQHALRASGTSRVDRGDATLEIPGEQLASERAERHSSFRSVVAPPTMAPPAMAPPAMAPPTMAPPAMVPPPTMGPVPVVSTTSNATQPPDAPTDESPRPERATRPPPSGANVLPTPIHGGRVVLVTADARLGSTLRVHLGTSATLLTYTVLTYRSLAELGRSPIGTVQLLLLDVRGLPRDAELTTKPASVLLWPASIADRDRFAAKHPHLSDVRFAGEDASAEDIAAVIALTLTR